MIQNEYKIIFYDSMGSKMAEVSNATGQNVVEEVNFELLETGCGAFDITFTDNSILLKVGDFVEIYLLGEATPYYAGYVQHIPETGRTDKIYKYTGYGLTAKLDEVVINTVYAATETSVIITAILDNEVLPKKPEIVKNPAKIVATAYTPTSNDFSLTKAKKAINSLASEAGDYIAGVDEMREFFFKARATTIQQAAIKAVAYHLDQFIPSQNNNGIINRYYIKIGAIASGSNYSSIIEDVPSQVAYGIREDVITMPEANNNTDAQKWALDLITKKKNPTVTASIKGIDILILRERIRAEGKARILVLRD